MTGAGKSVVIADLLSQIGRRLGFRLIVEEGVVAGAVLSQPQVCGLSNMNPNESFSIQNSERETEIRLVDSLTTHIAEISFRRSLLCSNFNCNRVSPC